jgi:hypothetical protein
VKKQKSNTAEISETSIAQKRINPFLKLMEDMKRIAEAFKNGVPLSSLDGIKFIQPI